MAKKPNLMGAMSKGKMQQNPLEKNTIPLETMMTASALKDEEEYIKEYYSEKQPMMSELDKLTPTDYSKLFPTVFKEGKVSSVPKGGGSSSGGSQPSGRSSGSSRRSAAPAGSAEPGGSEGAPAKAVPKIIPEGTKQPDEGVKAIPSVIPGAIPSQASKDSGQVGEQPGPEVNAPDAFDAAKSRGEPTKIVKSAEDVTGEKLPETEPSSVVTTIPPPIPVPSSTSPEGLDVSQPQPEQSKLTRSFVPKDAQKAETPLPEPESLEDRYIRETGKIPYLTAIVPTKEKVPTPAYKEWLKGQNGAPAPVKESESKIEPKAENQLPLPPIQVEINPSTQESFVKSGAGVLKDGESWKGTTVHQTGFQTVKDQLEWMSGKRVRGERNPDRLGYAAIIDKNGRLIETADPKQKTYHTGVDTTLYGDTERVNDVNTSIAHIGDFNPNKQGKALLESGELARFFYRRPGSLDSIVTHAEHEKNDNVYSERWRYEKGKGEGYAFKQFIMKNKDVIKAQIDRLKSSEIPKKVYGGELEMSPMPKQMDIGPMPDYTPQETETPDYESMIYSSVMEKIPSNPFSIPTNNPNLQNSMDQLYSMMDEYGNDTERRYYARCKFTPDDKDRFEFGTNLIGV